MKIVAVINGRWFHCFEGETFLVFDINTILNPKEGGIDVVGYSWVGWKQEKTDKVCRDSAFCQTFLMKVFAIAEKTVE